MDPEPGDRIPERIFGDLALVAAAQRFEGNHDGLSAV
jgi:hypothetical protein